ncbi:hypothetical protein GpartN1_g1625.t1 [Galdieria partita]|uniref:Uncharacterized protein n=1 Tax=Galdieria partita TaxID=83374 RepID=A0A9C7UNE3_9RHOD|nr:hypothetical protein GpartN1_g1625.t1 [Galdieria partita]
MRSEHPWQVKSIIRTLCFIFTLWWFTKSNVAVGMEQYSLRVEHSFDLGNTWLPRGQVHLLLKQELFRRVKPFEINFTARETDSLKQLALENQRYFIRASKTPVSELQQPVWLMTSYKACRLVDLSFRELVFVYLDANLELIGLGADFPLQGVCHNHSNWFSRNEGLEKLTGYWKVKTPEFPQVALVRKEIIEEVPVPNEQSFIGRNRWLLIVIGVLFVLNVLMGWIRFRLYRQSQSNHSKTD